MSPSVFSEVLELARDEEPRRARDVEFGDLVRAPFATTAHRALGVESLPGNYVRILWDCSPPPPMGPFTVFEPDEWVAIR